MAKRTEYYKIRLTKLEKKLLEKSAQNAGMQTAPFIRESALGNKITYKLTAEELEVLKDLTQFYASFKRIGNLFVREGRKVSDEMERETIEVAKAIRHVIDKLR